jgi:hypothetical protein
MAHNMPEKERMPEEEAPAGLPCRQQPFKPLFLASKGLLR